ncbi:MAG TPA: Gldg family protein [Kofleriaceae bacterium]|nr:Gldg family protein [Kofleriaceae bacterium]
MAMIKAPRLVSRITLPAALAALVVARRFLRDSKTGAFLYPVLSHMLTTFAVVAVVVGTGHQILRWRQSKGAQRRAEGTLLACYLGLVLAGILYFFTTKTGAGWVGADHWSSKGAHKYDVVMTIAAVLVAMCSVVPAVLIEVTVGEWRSDAEDDSVEVRRVHEMGEAGLTIALAAALMMVTCNVASEKNIHKDLSYFRTSAPGSSTRKIVEQMSGNLKVLLFFPDVNEVGTEVETYFRTLAKETGKVAIERADRMVDKAAAVKYQAQADGTVVLIRATGEGDGRKDKWEKFELDTNIANQRRMTGKLRVLDDTVNSTLMKIIREKRKIYLTVGHGELNDPDSLPEQLRNHLPDAKASVLKVVLGALNYDGPNLGLMNGLANDVPEDAAAVMVLGPRTPFDPAELATLGRYLDRGGHLLIAMDPEGEFDLGSLEGKLGVGLDRHLIADDKVYVPRRGDASDRNLVITNGFSSHPSTTNLSRLAANQGILLETAGALLDRPFAAQAAGGEAPKRTYVLRTMGSSWLDLDGDNVFDDGVEKRDRYNIGAAIEGPKVKKPDGTDGDGFRALVFSDQDLFADGEVMGRGGLPEPNGGPLVVDAVRWLGGEEIYSGQINNEKEKVIKQTAREQAGWFVATTVVAPLIVLVGGLLISTRPRARRSKKEKS